MYPVEMYAPCLPAQEHWLIFAEPLRRWPSGIRAKALAAQNVIDYLGLFFNAFVNRMFQSSDPSLAASG